MGILLLYFFFRSGHQTFHIAVFPLLLQMGKQDCGIMKKLTRYLYFYYQSCTKILSECKWLRLDNV